MDPSASQGQGYYANMNSGMISNNNNNHNYNYNYNNNMQQPMYIDPNSTIPPVLPLYSQQQPLPNYPTIYTSSVLSHPPPGVMYDGTQMQSPQMFQQQQYYNPGNDLTMQPVSYVPTTTAVYDSNAVFSNVNGYNSNSNSNSYNSNNFINNNYNNNSSNSNSNSGMMMDISSTATNQQHNHSTSLTAQLPPQPVSSSSTASSSTTSTSIATSSAAAAAPMTKLTADGAEPALLTPEEITKKLEDNDINLQAWEALLDRNQDATETVCAEDVAKHKELRQKIYENIDILRKIVKKQIKKTDAT